MLDATTKRKIDSARQILVGKVPDPKAQVEQITTALVYKFMDDMDKEAEELGGKAKFFTGDLKDFAWNKLLDTRLSGVARMDLYVRAISAFAKAKQLPQLFRDIFKDAFLPYRDPETLSLFLKEINNFTYDHSEDLGNAFEYLLSVLGSQGDAGQFRTPRHIIDFIVAIVDPKKNETVLDPACGTAGFLISAYKHIRKHNSSNFKPEKESSQEKLPEGNTIAETVLAEKVYRGDLLTPSERKKLMNNFVGYDISPDMVKLSLVNMYLHGFQEPKIYEYDTLTSEKHWGEQFDVIMANPPFMSPKGGIRPHKRFSVQASRSEVLFVDYILEHLNLKGRAGIIVPEGIIFKTENAYKRLRQMLVEDGLFVVVSLPPGVFNPYSGVKTSILLFDNQLAKKSDEILFLKIENDGFDLGAQRRRIDKNDLPEALEILEAWKKCKKKESNLALWVKKEKIAESGDYNLTGERYREVEVRKNQKWTMVELGEVAEVSSGNSAPQDKRLFQNGKYPFCRTSDVGKVHISINFKEISDYLNDQGIQGLRLFKKGTILFPKSGASTFLNHRVMLAIDSYVSSHLATIYAKKEKVLPKFLFYLLKNVDARNLTNNQNYPSLKLSEIKKIKIPLPPLEVQKEIVEQIEVKQNAINHAKEIIKNLERERRYFGQELRKLEDVKMIGLGEVCEELFAGGDVPKGYSKTRNDEKKIPIYTNGIGDKSLYGFTDKARVNKEAVTISARGTIGHPEIRKEPFYPAIRLIVAIPKSEIIDVRFLKYILETIEIRRTGNTIPQLTVPMVKKEKFPLPSLKLQKQLVAEAEKEEEIIAANRRLIDIMEKKINKVLSTI